jgi:cytochrome c-type biogenesis protein CcmE
MNKIHKRRLYMIAFSAVGIALAVGLILYALRQNINAFLTPTEIAVTQLVPDYHCRLGGLVKNGSLVREKQNLGVQFVVTDMQHDITVRYNGILPDLFREGKGMIAEGSIDTNGVFQATQILAKHDENYTPRKLQYLQGKS